MTTLAAIPLPEKLHAKRAPVRQFGTFEGLDNRRDLWRMLERLGDGVSPAEGCARRRAFFAECCQALQRKIGQSVKVDPKTVGTVRETYHDIIGLCVFPGWLDLEAVAKALERRVRRLAA